MGRDILKYGVIAGLVVAAGMWGTLLAFGKEMPHGMLGMALGYLTMLVALSAWPWASSTTATPIAAE